MISATFKDNSEIFAGIGLWIKNPTLEGYKNALNNFGGSINILQAMLNTYSYVLPKVICTVISSCVAAYGFGRFDFPGRKILFSIMLATLFLPQVVLNVPQFLLYTKFGWVNSPFYLAIWVHCAFATETYFVYQLVQFMRNVPRDLDEAAAIDGCNSFQTLYKVIVPMLMPALVSCALFQFMWSCNDFMGPLLYVQTLQSTRCPCSSSCPWTVIPALHGTASCSVPDLHPAAADRLLLCTGSVRRRYLRRCCQGLIALRSALREPDAAIKTTPVHTA